MTWRDRAACLGEDPELFFPERTQSPKEALAICARCEVVEDCLSYALMMRISCGVYGGTSAMKRIRTMRRMRREGP